ncbi:MAG: glutamyl-tRNA reductase [Pseudomonadota bacterium]|jgi:glutamyl-tRNA reductase
MSHGAPHTEIATPYDPSVLVTGVSYRTLSVEWREKLTQAAPQPEAIADTLVKQGLVREAAVLSTCNRFEIVSVGGDGGGIKAFFESLLGAPSSIQEALYQYRDATAVRHIYRVSSSLDSMVLGEAQILGQVKRAYQQAVQRGSVGAHLHHLFQSAFHVAKKVRTHTDVSSHGVSLSYVAVRLAQQIFADLADVSVVVIGSGEMAELAVLHLCSHGCKKIVVANRTLERAAELAERFGGMAVSLGDLDRVLESADIVIGSISIDRPVVGTTGVAARRAGRPLFLIDLGVPRNFASDLARLDDIYLYNIDDLAAVASENRALREAAAKDAEIVIDYGLMQFERWRKKIELQPELVDLRRAVERICVEGVSEALAGRIGDKEDSTSLHIARMISQKINHELTALLERQTGIESPNGAEAAPFVLVPVESNDNKKK